MEKYFYSISEVAEILGENPSLVRYWANEFSKYVKPERNAKGNRLFKKEDVDMLKRIHGYVKVEGLTLEGVQKRLREVKKGQVDKSAVLDSLESIRETLKDVRKLMN